MKVSAVLVGAGLGLRMGGKIKKPFLQLHGKPVFLYTLERFYECNSIDEIIFVVGKTDEDYLHTKWQELLDTFQIKKIVIGGKRRQDSVFNGITHIEKDTEIVLVHDIVRPLVKKIHIEEVVSKAAKFKAAILAAPMKATVKETWNDLSVKRTIPRDKLWMAQTPQGFERRLLFEVFDRFRNIEKEFTDEAQMVEEAGHHVHTIISKLLPLKIYVSQRHY